MSFKGVRKNPPGKKVVVFDFDETLTVKNTLKDFSKLVLGNNARFYLHCFLSAIAVPLLFFSKTQQINPTPMAHAYPIKYRFIWKSRCVDIFRRVFLRLLSKHSLPEIEDVIAKKLHDQIDYIDEAVQKLKNFSEQDDVEVWIATGSSRIFVEAIARYNQWNVDKVIGTNIYGEKNMAELECIRRNKSQMIKDEMQDDKFHVHEAYGNMFDDMPMLDLSERRKFIVQKDQTIFEMVEL